MVRTTTIAIILMMASGASQAEIVGEAHRYSVGGTEFEGYVARNTNAEPRGTVLIVHDWDGLTDYERRRADMLAAAGYTAFAIDVYGAEDRPQSPDENREFAGRLYGDRELFRARLLGSLEEASNLEGATDDKVMMGYCFGGAGVLEAARAGADAAGFVSFHGGLGTPEGQDYSAASGPILLLHGSADPVSGMPELAVAIEAMRNDGAEHDARVFGGARHSFTVFGSGDYDLEADRASWDALTEFLDARF
ncbi:dienelactone hydrolase family protein [Acuticoccus sp.]|uniref:dienelactone hydrolase family protein n=1 Tax=Acuticoccus sp. TaxID=1904378 RepID=UPI003B51C84F